MMQKNPRLGRVIAACAFVAAATGAHAADWSDTSLGWRYGTRFAEPFNPNDIKKHILNLTHVSGYKYGTNFFNADLLLSDADDPAGVDSDRGAHEIYVVYRHTLDLEKVTGTPFKWGPVRGLGLTAGFDINSKTDAGYNSKKRMLVAGPTLMVDVPGFLNVGLYALWESNAPCNNFNLVATPPQPACVSRYRYDTHPVITAAWSIPIGATGLSFEGFANFIASKGKDEFGGDTAPETNIDAQVMYDLGAVTGAGANKIKVGVEYQYWRNKFGNDHNGPAGRGAFAKTPMVRLEYHF